MGRDATKPVFGVSDKVKFKSACSATETSWKIEILLIAILDNDTFQEANDQGADQTAQVAQAGLHLCCSQTPHDGFFSR